MPNTYQLSNGERMYKNNIDANVRITKQLFVIEAKHEGKQYCWACGITGDRLSCSHIISVDRCQKISKSDLAWDKNNLQLECIPCHRKWENRDHIFKHANYRIKREYILLNDYQLYTTIYEDTTN